MPRTDDDVAFLSDMLAAARQIIRYTTGATFHGFFSDDMMRRATERQLEIIGEAAGRVSKAFRDANPEIPWRRMIAQRNVLAHEYGEIKVELIWKLVQAHLPQLIEGLESLVPTPPPDPEAST
jgi:uncharacterized protein with HEPN domain